MKHSKKRNKGFTLLEVMISLVIILGGILLVTQSWSGNFMRVRKANLYNNVSLLLQRKMTELEAAYKNKPLEEVPENKTGDFGKEFPQYRWEMSSQEFEFPDLSSALVGRDEGASETLLTMTQQMKEYISKAVKEVTLTIYVKTPLKELAYSVTTYFVDYNQELTVGGGL